MWGGWQGDEATQKRATKKWKTNLARYRANLPKLVDQLGSRHGRFFTHHSLHDGRLLHFTISDWPRSNLRRKIKASETSVEILVLAWGAKALVYQLMYKGIKGITVHTKNSLFPMDNSLFGDWGYDELLAERNGGFRHNILFQTGTEISIAFQKFTFKRSKGRDSDLKQAAR